MVHGELELWWGDPHVHSSVSRRCFKFGLEPEGYDGSPGDCHRYARDEAGMDFSAVTDHDCTREKREMTPREWEEVRGAAEQYSEPGQFVAFPAFEYSNRRQGHYHVLFSHPDPPLLAVDEYPTPEDLWTALDIHDKRALTIPHHIARAGMPNDWSYFDPHYEAVVEICSVWGCYEFPGNPFECDPNWSSSDPRGFARVGLGEGLTFGFVGGGDIHDGRAGGRAYDWRTGEIPERWKRAARYRRNPLGGGLTGVYANRLSRDGLIEGLRKRRSIACTGSPTEVSMRVDGLFIGDIFPASDDQARNREIEVEAASQSSLRSLEVIRNGHILFHLPCNGKRERLEFTDELPLVEVDPSISSGSGSLVYYYARVTREDFHMAWTSPIWLKTEGHG